VPFSIESGLGDIDANLVRPQSLLDITGANFCRCSLQALLYGSARLGRVSAGESPAIRGLGPVRCAEKWRLRESNSKTSRFGKLLGRNEVPKELNARLRAPPSLLLMPLDMQDAARLPAAGTASGLAGLTVDIAGSGRGKEKSETTPSLQL
jgi:hypothetical protein